MTIYVFSITFLKANYLFTWYKLC